MKFLPIPKIRALVRRSRTAIPFPPELEILYREDKAKKVLFQRRIGVCIAALMWGFFIIWDLYFHTSINQKIINQIIGIRAVGAVILLWYVAVSFQKRFKSDAYAERVLITCVVVAWVGVLAMIRITPPPQNYLDYYPGLPLIYVFLFTFLWIRPKKVIATGIGLAIMFALVQFSIRGVVELKAPEKIGEYIYYSFSAGFYLFNFFVIGTFVCFYLERSLRLDFKSRRQQAAAILEKEALNRTLVEERAKREEQTNAMLQMKEEQRAQAVASNHQKSFFLASAAHDLRQPLTALSAIVEALGHAISNKDATKIDEYFQVTRQSTKAMRLTLNAVLEISRLESGFVTPEYEKLDIDQLVSELFEQHVSIAKEKGLEFRLWMSKKQVPLYVKTDRVLLTRILTNLISNALKYTVPKRNQKSGVIVGLIRLGTTIRVDIVDTGLGIDESHRNAIFQPFFQISNRERDREKGLGLGLSIVAEMVSLLDHHRLDFSSKLGCGTRFSLDLPLVQDYDNLNSIAISKTGAEDVDTISLLGIHILLVEDDGLVRKSMCAILESWGMTVTDCGDFDEVLDFLRNAVEIPNLILTDFRLPDAKTAIDVIESIRTELECNIPTIVMSGEVTSLKSVQHLAAEILTKPVDSAVLMSTIRKVHSAAR